MAAAAPLERWGHENADGAGAGVDGRGGEVDVVRHCVNGGGAALGRMKACPFQANLSQEILHLR